MNDSDVLIKILTAFEGGGIEAAKKAAQDLKKEMGDSAGGSDMLKKAMEALDGKGKQAGDTLRGLYGLMTKQGPAAVNALGKTVQGLAQTFGLALGPAGAIASIAMAGFQVVKGIMDQHAAAVEEAAQKAREAAEKEAADAKKHLEELDKVRLEAVNAAVTQLKEGLDAAAQAADSTRKHLDALEDSELGVDTARIDARVAAGEIDAAQGEWEKADLRLAAADRKDQREIDNLEEEEKALARAEADTAQAAAEAASELAKAQEALAAAQAELEAAKKPNARLGYIAAGEQQKRIGEATAVLAQAQAAAEEAGTKKEAADAAALAAQDTHSDRGADIANRLQVLRNSLTARSWQRDAALTKITAHKNEETRQWVQNSFAERGLDPETGLPVQPPEAPAPTPRSLSAEVGAMVGRGQRYGDGQLYDIDGGATRRQALGTLREAVNNAAASKGGDAEEAAIIAQAVDAIGSMGANLLADKAQINAKLQELVNAIQKVESQVKNGRS